MFCGLRASWKINRRREGWVGRMLLVPVLIARLDLWACWGWWKRVWSSDVSILVLVMTLRWFVDCQGLTAGPKAQARGRAR